MLTEADDNITLEPFDIQYAKAFFTLIDANRKHLREWLPWVDRMRSAEDFKKFIIGSKKRQANHSEVSFAIFVNGHLAGRIGLYSINRQNKIAQIGYWLAQHFQGKGIITKTCKLLIQYAFDKLDINRIEIHCATENYKSQAVPERLQFKKEGIVRQGEFLNNAFVDLYTYSLLKQEWQTKVSTG